MYFDFVLYREEVETPKVWAQICLQRMVELAKESTTMRLILEPMFLYFDTRRHWLAPQGLAMMVLSDMSYYVECQGDFFFVMCNISLICQGLVVSSLFYGIFFLLSKSPTTISFCLSREVL